MSMTIRKISIPAWLPKTAIIFFINLGLLAGAYFGFAYAYKDKIYPGVYVGKINLSGKQVAEAKKIVDEEIKKISTDGLSFFYGQEKSVIFPIMLSPDGSVAYDLVMFNSEKTVQNAYEFGRHNGFLPSLKERLSGLIFQHSFAQEFTLDEEMIKKTLLNNFFSLETPAKNAELFYIASSNGSSTKEGYEIIPEQSGRTINYDQGLEALKINISNLNNLPITLNEEKKSPEILAKDCLNIEKKAEEMLAIAPFTIINEKKKWIIEKKDLAGWLHLELNTATGSSSTTADKVLVALNSEVVKSYLNEKLGPSINKKATDAKFQMADGKLISFQTQSDGQEIDLEASFQKINSEIFLNNKKEVELAVKEIKSDIGLAEVNNLGLNEIIGTGESNFAGSPKNRRHNIRIGANAVNGTLVKPDEEFSLLKVLGTIDGSTGYLTELVIKDNKTIPEFGGGLCQIGTTAFRAALATGLPITQRRNHSYRVVYYEPAGTDATIYDPWPDFRFINDTGNYILIQSRIVGDNLYFDVWGTKDGREIKKTKPTVYNIVKPAPGRIIETLSLKPGEKRCTERAHNGADAYFDYKVTYSSGEVKEERFSSHYIPWQEVCLLGVKELSASSTPSAIDSLATSSAALSR